MRFGGNPSAGSQQNIFTEICSVERRPASGSYDLHITNATHARDNAEFRCVMKETSGKLLHTSKIGLTILVKPSPPVISPRAPLAVEGTVTSQ